jgi:hypothetical protein
MAPPPVLERTSSGDAAPHAGSTGREATLWALGLIALVGLAALGAALWFPPTDGDDLVLLSAAARAHTPFVFFAGDWGLGNGAYRPLHSLLLWITYRLAGTSAAYSQVLSLGLHVACMALVYRLICSVVTDRVLAVSFTLLALVSMYTASSATWVSDRPTLLVALAVLAWLVVADVTGAGAATARRSRTAWLVGLSILALLSKESGLVLPLLAVYWTLTDRGPSAHRGRVITAAVAVVVAYAGLRVLVFGTGALHYGDSRYLALGPEIIPQGLPTLRVLAGNLGRNLIAPFVQILTDDGGMLTINALTKTSLTWVPIAVLGLLAIRRHPTPLQRAGLAIVVLNACVHWAIFRYRTLYLAQVGLTLFLAGSVTPICTPRRIRLVKGLTAAVALSSVVWVGKYVDAVLVERTGRLDPAALHQLAVTWGGGIDPAILARISEQYHQ